MWQHCAALVNVTSAAQELVASIFSACAVREDTDNMSLNTWISIFLVFMNQCSVLSFGLLSKHMKIKIFCWCYGCQT
jgi:hypothetical protein